MFYKNLGIYFAFAIILFACNQVKKESKLHEKDKILKLHHLQRDYHFNKDSIAFANQLSNNFISVNKGEITFPKKDETLARYNRYFSSVEFIKWDDLSEPIIKFSNDSSMAYTVVEKEVIITYKDSSGSSVEGKTLFAWTAIYRKENGEWKIECVTSTNKPIN
ncbi:nuclear transport factor 2 family protein [Sabulilitoribacter multivorans]|uniref:Nuclear transport factor 2 family protein n=1 Tax=Flaviramulus multivorans TaxID=1304750 RepID=A0ABS9IKB0_9FLAO|nr:nuclear transport factor 2 family protein [Flaviramulus multivorans]MCF7561043.1 nuclear transport factor 2 family protein [Flaviramulus multivorans]